MAHREASSSAMRSHPIATERRERWSKDSLIKPKPPRDIGPFRLRMPYVGLSGEGPDSNLTKAR